MRPENAAPPGRRALAKKIRGVTFEENLSNSMGLEFYNLSHRFGYQSPNWPYFEDVKIERIHYMAKSGVLSQRMSNPKGLLQGEAPCVVTERTCAYRAYPSLPLIQGNVRFTETAGILIGAIV